MRQTKMIMGMPITVEVISQDITSDDIKEIFDYFRFIDKRFSPFKKDSEVSLINQGQIAPREYSAELKEILTLAEHTKQQTRGFFNVWYQGKLDPSGIVKGWAIHQATKILVKKGFKDFYINAGGDIAAFGKNSSGDNWGIGIRNPFDPHQTIKILNVTQRGVATSGTSAKGSHIYNPLKDHKATSVAQITVIGSNVYEADRMATTAFAMGEKGIYFIESLPNFEGYMIDLKGVATQTTHFSEYAKDR